MITRECEVCPPEASDLEILLPAPAASLEVRRCRSCGTLYRYRHHYEFLIGGSYDEYFLWRLPDDAQPVIASILADPSRRDELLTAALRHDSDVIRETATLLFWGCVCAGEKLPGAVRAAAEGRPDPTHSAKNQSYHGLLEYLDRGSAEAALVAAALEEAKANGLEHGYAKTLRSRLARRS